MNISYYNAYDHYYVYILEFIEKYGNDAKLEFKK